MSAIETKHPAITQELRKKILCGFFGEKLPPLRTLMREYQVSMQTINKAVKPLADMGLIAPGPRGSVIVASPKKRPRYYAVGILWTHGSDYDEEAWRTAVYIQEYLGRKNYNVVFLNTQNPNLRGNPDFWQTLPIDGLLFAFNTVSAEIAWALHYAGIPAVAPHYAGDLPIHVMEHDSFPAIESVVKALHGKGWRRIALQFGCDLVGYQDVANTRWDRIRSLYDIPDEYRENIMPGNQNLLERHTKYLCLKNPPDFILCWHAYPEQTYEILKSIGMEKKVRIVSFKDGDRLNRMYYRLTPHLSGFLDNRLAFLEKIIAEKPKEFLHEYVPYQPVFIDDIPESKQFMDFANQTTEKKC